MEADRSNSLEIIKRDRWVYLALFCLMNFCTGALYVWSVFAGPLAGELTATSGTLVRTSDLAPVFGLATGVTPFLMLAGGFVNDRFGPKLTIAFGGAAIAAGYAATACATSVGMLYAGYGLCVGVGTGLVNGCTINSAVKWFPDRRGFAGGLVTACLGVGAAVLPFAARGLIEVCGIAQTLLVFGTCSGLVIVLCALKTRKCPDGLQAAFGLSGGSPRAAEPESLQWFEMVRTPRFYPLFLLFASSAMMGLMLLSNISSIAEEQVGAGAALAALSVSVISIANTSGRFLSGTLSDRFGRIPTLILMLLAALAGLAMLMSAGRRGPILWGHRVRGPLLRSLHRHLSEPGRGRVRPEAQQRQLFTDDARLFGGRPRRASAHSLGQRGRRIRPRVHGLHRSRTRWHRLRIHCHQIEALRSACGREGLCLRTKGV